jgi:hypothetical protein
MENKTYGETLVRYRQEQGLSKTRLALCSLRGLLRKSPRKT